MDASRYRKHYGKLESRTPDDPISADSEECIYVKMLWQRLLEAYIVPNGAREVNLPSDVRDPLLALSNSHLPPHPSTLEPAVACVHKLMEESVLVPFLNSLCPSNSARPESASSEDPSRHYAYSYDERYRNLSRDHNRRSSPPPASAVTASLGHKDQPPNRASAPSSFSQFARGFHLGGKQGFLQLTHNSNSSNNNNSNPTSTSRPTSTASTISAGLSTYASNSSAGSTVDGPVADDSSASTGNGPSSPTYSTSALSDALMTPPTTPSMSDYYCAGGGSPPKPSSSAAAAHGHGAQPAHRSPRNSRGDASMGAWKKMRSSFGFKKRGGGGGSLREEDDDELMS